MSAAKLITRAYQHSVGAAYFAMVLRDLGDGTYTTEASCSHRHRTPKAAKECARRMARRARKRLNKS